MVNMIQGPIPGQSLTDEPKNAPWENPSEMNTVEEVVKHYVTTFADQDVMDDVAVAFELGADLRTFTNTVVTMGAMKGLHTVETGMLAGPTLASFIKIAMQSYGIETPETPISMKEDISAKERSRLKTLLDRAVSDAYADGNDSSDPGVALIEELSNMDNQEGPMDSSDEGPTDLQVETTEETPKPDVGKGLMSRGDTV